MPPEHARRLGRRGGCCASEAGGRRASEALTPALPIPPRRVAAPTPNEEAAGEPFLRRPRIQGG
jgi:hypothetical protein